MSGVRSIPGRSLSLEGDCDSGSVRDLCRHLREFLANARLAGPELDAWELILAEAANNAVANATPAGRQLPVRIDLVVTPEWIEVRVTDHTPGFDCPEKAELPPDDSESGRGLFLIQNLADEVLYLRGRGENCMVLRRRPVFDDSGAAAARPADPAAALSESRRTLDLMTEELAATYEILSAIFQFSAELVDGAGSGDFARRWLRQLLAITECDWFVLRLCGDAGGELRVLATSVDDWTGVPIPLSGDTGGGGSVEARAARDKADLWFDGEAPLDPGDPLAALARGGVGFSHPIFVNDTLVGVLSVGRHAGGQSPHAGQINVIQTFADFLGIRIRSASMQEEQVRSRLDARDLEIAAEIQRSLLPLRLPAPPGLRVEGGYRSARQVGGDFHDVIITDDGNLLMVVADVMGKGLPAAIFAAIFRSLVRSRPDLASEPARFLGWLEANVARELDRVDMFITAQLAFLNVRAGRLTVSGAGHQPLLVADPSGVIVGIESGRPPLGIGEQACTEVEHLLPRGFRIFAHTDGLSEARNREGRLLGMEPLRCWLAEAARRDEEVGASRRRLEELLENFAGDTPPSDDQAFVLVADAAGLPARS